MSRMLLLVVVVAATCGVAKADDKLFVAEVYNRQALKSRGPSTNLAPSLVATKDANGVFKGTDRNGRPIIAIAEEDADKLRASRAVLAGSVSQEIPSEWNAVARLKLSYEKKSKPTLEDLKRFELKLVEDYVEGEFMLVEPLNSKISAKLIGQLEGDAKVQYVTPSAKLKVVVQNH